MTYSEKLKHPKWQKKRLEIMQRDNFKCRCCLDCEKTLNVHHIYYDNKYKNPWDYPNELLITMCEECHEQEHDYKIEYVSDLLIKDLIFLSNKPISEIYNILDNKHLLINCDDFTEKEAIKHLLLKTIQGL
jgi:formate-dependent nitrite reductase cytochrome c552 subunit